MTDPDRLPSNLVRDFAFLCDRLRDAGFNVVACVSRYDTRDVIFSTRLSTRESTRLGLTEDHILLDALREVLVSWSNSNHRSQLTWDDLPPNGLRGDGNA